MRTLRSASIAVLSLAMVAGVQAGARATSPARAMGVAALLARPVGPNVNVSRMAGNQSENTIAIDPTNPNRIAVTSNLENASGLFHGWSTDGGATWQTDIIADGGGLGFACCDSSMVADNYGNFFLTYLASSVYVALSTDGGATFTRIAAIKPEGGVPHRGPRAGKPGYSRLPNGDQPSITAGNGEVWVTWTSFSTGAVQAAGAAVSGLGQVGPFSAAENAQGAGDGDYGDVAIGPDGEVMVVYQNPTGGEGPASIYTDLDPDGLGPQGFQPAKLTQVTNVGGFDYIPAQAGRSVDAETEFAWDRTGGAHNGRLYLLYTSEFPQESNDMDIQVMYTDDDGTTWSSPVRVNDDSGTNSQFNPRIALDPTTGFIALSWYDCRNDLGTHGPGDTNGIPNDDAMVYGAVSKNGGVSFLPNLRVAARPSNSADAQNGIDFGDYEGLAYYGGNFYPLWADNSNSTHDNPDGTLHELDIYTAKVHVH